MITNLPLLEAKVLLSTLLSALLFSGPAVLPLPLSTNKPESSSYVDQSPDAKLLQSRIDALVAPYFESSSFSGDVLAMRNGEVVFHKGYGLANHERAVPVTSQTKFYVASISKSFTAAAILLLQERGKLQVTDPVTRFIPDFPNGDQITIHHLLTHRAGIADFLRFPNFAEISQKPYTTKEVVKLFQDKPLTFKPGARSTYSNSNYVLLAYIVELVSGLNYPEFLKTNFFKPLGMQNTGQSQPSDDSIANLATGYAPVGLHEFEKTRHYDHSIATGAGSLYSTAEDVSKWIQGLLAGRVLKKSSVEQMVKPHPDGTSGYSLNLSKLWNRDAITENGWDGVGFAGTLIHFPNDNVTVVVLGNLNISTVAGELAQNISATIFGENFEALKPNLEPISPALSTKLVGKYKLGNDFFVPGAVLDIVERDGNLYEQQHSPDQLVGLIRISELEFIHRSSWGRMKFKTDETGQVTGMLFMLSSNRFNADKLTAK